MLFNNHRGRLGRCWQRGPVKAAEIHNQDRAVAEHAHDHPHFWLTLEGEYQVDTAGLRQRVGRSSLVYTAAHEPHRDRLCRPGAYGLTISVDASFVSDQLGPVGLPLASVITSNPFAVALATRAWRELMEPDAATPLFMSGLGVELLAHLTRDEAQAGVTSDLYERALEAFAETYRTPGTTIASTAHALGVHPVHLARAFRMRNGPSPSAYVRQLRCNRAAHLLAGTGTSLVDIALMCGFSDQSGFTAAFRRTTGLTPGAYRRSFF